MNRVYDAQLVITNRELLCCPITVTFRNPSLEAILNVLEVTLDLQIKRKENEIRLDGRRMC